MPIPDFKKHRATEAFATETVRLKALPELATVTVHPSFWLRCFYRVFYSLVAAALWMAVAPYLLESRFSLGARAVGLLLAISASFWLLTTCRQQCAAIARGSFGYSAGGGQGSGWWFRNEAGSGRMQCRSELRLAGEVLCWPWLIILPLQDAEGRRQTLLISQDALTPADQARLRTWLRACLRPKA